MKFISTTLLLIGLNLCSNVSLAKSTIKKVKLYQEQTILYADIISRIQLPTELKKVIKSGLTLTFYYQFKIKETGFFHQRAIVNIKKNYRLSYHPTIDRYEIQNPITFETKYYKNFDELGKVMQVLTHFPVVHQQVLTDKSVAIKVRFMLDKNQLPIFLRLESLFSDNWEVNSDWSTWKLL